MGLGVRLAKASAAFGALTGQLAVKVVSSPPVMMYRSVRAAINPDLRTEQYFAKPNPLERLVGINDNWPNNLIEKLGLSHPPAAPVLKSEEAAAAAIKESRGTLEVAGKWSKGTKWGLGIGAAAAALIGFGLLSRHKKEAPSDEVVIPLSTATAEQALANAETAIMNGANQAASTAKVLQDGPAEGYGKNQWQQTVAAARGQAPKDMGPINPKMNVVPESSVQNLGAPPVIGK